MIPFKLDQDMEENTPIYQPKPVETTPTGTPGGSVTPEQSGSVNVQPPPVSVPPPPQKKKLGKILAIIGVVFAVAVIILFVIRLISSPSRKTKGGEIVWWGIRYDEAAIKPLLDSYEAESGVRVTYVKQSPLDYRERLTSAIAKGEGPDIFQIHNTWPVMFKNSLETLPSSVMTESEFSITFYPVVASDMSSGKGFVGIPLSFDALTLFVNTEILQRENKTIPVTWEDLSEVSKEITKRDENDVITQSGVAMGRTENVDYWEEIVALLFLQNGASLVSPGDDLSTGAMDFFLDFTEEDEGTWDTTMADSVSAFSAGKLAFLFAPSERATEIKSTNPALNFVTIPLPQIAKSTPDQPSVSYANYWVESVSSKSSSANESWKFLKYMSKKESVEKLHVASPSILGIYPRVDMKELQIDDPVLGSVVKLAPDAESWYLVSEVFDGITGINSQVRGVYKIALDSLNQGMTLKKTLETFLPSLDQVLTKYGLLN